jgi:hypothetical protein
MPRLSALVLLAAVTALPLATSAAGIYKWQDADGKTHFSDKPPPDVEAETIKAPTAPAAQNAGTELEALTERVEENYQRRMEQRAEQAREREEAEKIAAHCADTRAKLERLQTSTRRQIINAQGEREFLPEEQRQAWMRQAREELEKHCK